MTRALKDWLPAFMEFTKGTEAPRIMHFWAGVSAIAGVLRRRVWIDMKRFKWYPGFYIVFVAPPGIISKTTTMDLSMDLLKQVPGIKFGPDVVTWQALVSKFAESGESFQLGEDWIPMSPLTLASGELGNLINPQDRDMINLYITLWDGRSSFEKVTKMSGNDTIEAPWINMIGCTTPHWIADNMPAATVGGGFTSRCVFVWGDKKECLIALPDEFAPLDHDERARELVNDLEHIAVNLLGPCHLPEETRVWVREWYRVLWTEQSKTLDDDRLEGYLARKQTHMLKLSIILSASRSDDRVISLEDVILANSMLEQTEVGLHNVFSRIGRTENSLQAERFVAYVKRRVACPYADALRYIHDYFPDFRDFEGMLAGVIRAGMIKMRFTGQPRMGPDGKMEQDAELVYCGGA